MSRRQPEAVAPHEAAEQRELTAPDEWKEGHEGIGPLCDVTNATPMTWPRSEAVGSRVLVPPSETTLFSSSHVAKNLYFWQEAINGYVAF